MADLSDVTAYLMGEATTACYPNGTGQPSIAGGTTDIRIFEGWPLPDQLELDMQGKSANPNGGAPIVRARGPLVDVSIFPMLGTNAIPYQIQDQFYVIAQPVFGLSLAVNGNTITFSGTPNPGEYVGIIADGGFSAHSETGATAAAIISALATDFTNDYGSGVSSTSSTLTIPFTRSLVVRQGGQGTLGKVTHRQRQQVMVSVWAPKHTLRSTVAAAIDNYIKQNIRVTLPDTSQAVVCYNRTNTSDDMQMAGVYRRDLIYDVEYATVFEFPGFVVVIVSENLAATPASTPQPPPQITVQT